MFEMSLDAKKLAKLQLYATERDMYRMQRADYIRNGKWTCVFIMLVLGVSSDTLKHTMTSHWDRPNRKVENVYDYS